jgi:hypothetical protein
MSTDEQPSWSYDVQQAERRERLLEPVMNYRRTDDR